MHFAYILYHTIKQLIQGKRVLLFQAWMTIPGGVWSSRLLMTCQDRQADLPKQVGRITKCPTIYRKSVLHLLKIPQIYTSASAILGHSVLCIFTPPPTLDQIYSYLDAAGWAMENLKYFFLLNLTLFLVGWWGGVFVSIQFF